MKPPRSLIVLVAVATLALGACSESPDAGTSPTSTDAPVEPLDPGRDPVVQVVERVGPAVVNVTTNVSSSVALDVPRQRGEGTGFVVRDTGIVVTNFHVLEGGLNIQVVTSEGERLPARVIGGDPEADLAVLEVDAEEDLPMVPLGSSERLQLGEQVVALGFALGLEGGPTVTSGIVSALDRSIEAGGPGVQTRTYENVIQTDAAINPGNSGGPLVDLSGRVVGINTAGVRADSAENIGFAIAIDRAKSVIEEAIEDPAAEAGYLGVSTQTVDQLLVVRFGLPVDSGALVRDVAPNGPADRAGIEPGDVIVGIGGQGVGGTADVRNLLAGREPGEDIELDVVHLEGSQETITVNLGVRPFPVE
jgi:S1-C subfamily serine protease